MQPLQQNEELNCSRCNYSPSWHQFGVRTLAETFDAADLENSADGTAVLASRTVQAHEVLTAIVGVSVAGEGASGGQFTRGWAHEVLLHGVYGREVMRVKSFWTRKFARCMYS